ncbi:MAG TPA: hypothetical protein VKT72_11390 [Candidatus Baltobacteraceae bacterium]|nr:hypothetical protein [Candidatus Baltobacteraceae bacterium]
MIEFSVESALRSASGARHHYGVMLSEESREVIESWSRTYRFSRQSQN